VTNCRFGVLNYLRHNLLQKPALTDDLCIDSRIILKFILGVCSLRI
jgi:hypothetical protein